MSARTDFIRAIVEEGITAARRYFGTAIEKNIPKREIESAKLKFKNNKKNETARKKTAAKKADKKRERANTTQLNKTDKKTENEGAGKDPETGGSVSAARQVESGQAGKVTRGSASVTNFIKDQMAMSPGMQARSKQDKAFARMIRNAKTKKEKEALQEALNKIREKRRRADAKQRRDTNIKIAQTQSGKTKPKRTDYVDPETGEVFGNPTKNQLTQAARNFRARNMSAAARRVEAAMEEASIQQRGGAAGETSVGPRQGTRGMNTRAEETQVKNMISGTGDRQVTRLSGEAEEELRKRTGMKRGGKVTKRAIGAHDFRMNKGGLLLSSVDNRKRK